MAETPDFEKLAQHVLENLPDAFLTRGASASSAVPAVVEQLRLIWNARGAADLVTIESSLSSQMGSTAAGPYVKNLDRDLRKLDR